MPEGGQSKKVKFAAGSRGTMGENQSIKGTERQSQEEIDRQRCWGSSKPLLKKNLGRNTYGSTTASTGIGASFPGLARRTAGTSLIRSQLVTIRSLRTEDKTGETSASARRRPSK
jgi:hypothetical protein